jgi:DNA polymerase-3 subunit delta
VKLTGARIAGFLRSPDPAIRAILVYGPDSGAVRERITLLAKRVVPDLKDPFRVADFPAASLKDEPGRLVDEACALSFGGGRRVVILRSAGDGATPACRSLLTAPPSDALVLVEGDDLGKRSSLRLLFEESDGFAALPCYLDDEASLGELITETLRAEKIQAEPDAITFLAERLGADRALTRSELAKLVLYIGGSGRLSLADAIACVGDGASLSLDDLAMAVAEGDQAGLQRILERLLSEGNQPVSVIRALNRHFQRLHLCAGQIAQGRSIEQAVGALKPPLFFRDAPRFKAQLQRWTAPRLAQALEILLTAETDCKTTGLPAAAICGRAMMQLARAAGAGARRR